MFGMKALPYVGELAKQVDKGVPYLSGELKVVPFVVTAYGEAAMQDDESLGTVSAGLKAAPYVTKAASQVAQEIDPVMPFGEFGDVSSSSRYIAAEIYKRTS